jgi:hypothetical protein
MKLICVQDFGLHHRGDTVVIPDGAEFSPAYFQEAKDKAKPSALASDEATGRGMSSTEKASLKVPEAAPGATDDEKEEG